MELQEYEKMDKLEADHWWFKAKRNFLRLAIRKEVGDLKGKKVLDVGCGTGAILQMLVAMGANAEGVDSSPDALVYCRKKNLVVVEGDGVKLPYKNGIFDLVIASDVLEHIEQDTDAVAEIKRVLKPGGIFVATVPAHAFIFSHHDTVLHHFRRYNKQSLSLAINKYFNKIKINWIHSLILFPAIIKRTMLPSFANGRKESDVQMSFASINFVMNNYYRLELFLFKSLGLPFGLSLIVIAKN